MAAHVKNVAVLGSTGSIGESALAVIAASRGQLRAICLSAHSRTADLLRQAKELAATGAAPRWLVATDPQAAAAQDWSDLPTGTVLLVGHAALEQTVRQADVDVVLAAIVGSAGLRSTWAALDAGKTIALANKETLVMAGSLVMSLAAERNTPILPVDSEHSAVFQALQSGRKNEVRRVVLTASGGPFRKYSIEQMATVTVAEALAHPTWNMGPKITVDSATMMNKSLELIEARWLFDLTADQLDVVIHPQSIVHSLVEFIDGSVIAQLSPPDMKLPIQYALTYPDRTDGVSPRLDWSQAFDLKFEPPDYERFPALSLGREAARVGGTTGAVLNAANEAAVAGFLAGELAFTDIVPACRDVLDHHEFDPSPKLEQLIALDSWARQEVSRWVCT